MTEAGKAFRLASQRYAKVTRTQVAAIEAEAVTAALTALRAQVEELPGYPDGLRPGSVRRTAVLAAIDAAMPGGKK